MAIDMNTVITGVKLTKVCSVRPDGESENSKQVTVHMDYEGLTIGDVFQKALKTDIISWQSSARKRFDKLKTTENVKASKPGSMPQLSGTQQLLLEARAAGIDMADPDALMEFIKNKLEETL